MCRKGWWWLVLVFLVLAVTLAFAKSIIFLSGLAVYAFGPLYTGPLISALTYVGLRTVRGRRVGASSGPSVWASHGCAILAPIIAPFLWFAGCLADAFDQEIFLQSLFFLPVMCALTLKAPQGVYYAVITAGVPGQYLGVGALVDALREDSRSSRTIALLLVAALSTAAMLLWFLLAARPYPSGPFLTTAQFVAVVAFHCTVVVALVFDALRRWREHRATVKGRAGYWVQK